jgi:hypothetical protein
MKCWEEVRCEIKWIDRVIMNPNDAVVDKEDNCTPKTQGWDVYQTSGNSVLLKKSRECERSYALPVRSWHSCAQFSTRKFAILR